MRHFLIYLALLFLLPTAFSQAFSLQIGRGGDSEKKVDITSLFRAGKAVSKTFEDITPEQEYFIGRTVSAIIVNEYKPYDLQAANDYLNLLGQTLAQASDLPETFGGYHFLILDSESINAFAAPSGLIFVTKGLIRCCPNEDALAAVLAHEIGHVQYKHGLQAIKKSRVTSALTAIGIAGVASNEGVDMTFVPETFYNSVNDITTTLINNGYSKKFEYAADQAAVTIMNRVGYNPAALLDMLKIMKDKLKPDGTDFAKTHPSPKVRIKKVRKKIDKTPVSQSPARQNRFEQFISSI
ncbi:M48 family metallopeptidase [Thermodesulfobacteriota bacterium]